MTAAELRTIRENCGLSVVDLAALIISPTTKEPVERRTVTYWETGRSRIPKDVTVIVLNLNEKINLDALNLAERVKATEFNSLIRYRTEEALWKARKDYKGLPVACHAAMLFRAKELLDGDDGSTQEIYIDYDDR